MCALYTYTYQPRGLSTDPSIGHGLAPNPCKMRQALFGRPVVRQGVGISRKLPRVVLRTKTDLVLVVVHCRPWAIGTQRAQPRRVGDHTKPVAVIQTILFMAMIQVDDVDARQLDKLLKAIQIHHLRRPNMLHTEVVANFVLGSRQRAHMDTNLRVPVELLVSFIAIGISFETLSILSSGWAEGGSQALDGPIGPEQTM